jgi:serine/threonine-protein kinase RsbW
LGENRLVLLRGTSARSKGGPLNASGNRQDEVQLAVPAALEYVRIVRLTGSGVASRLGFDVDEIENLRVAIDELASMVVEFASDGVLDISFFTTNGELRIEGSAPVRPGVEVAVEDLTAQILKAVCDEYALRADNGNVRFSYVRRLPEA